MDLVRDFAAEWDSRHFGLIFAIVGSAVFMPFLVLVHEVGHALAALALRRRLVELRVGDEEPIFRLRVRGFRVLLGPVSDNADVGGYLLHDGSAPGPWVILIIALAGPVASLGGAVTTGVLVLTLPLGSHSYVLALFTLGGILLSLGNLQATGDEPHDWSDGRWVRFALRELRR